MEGSVNRALNKDQFSMMIKKSLTCALCKNMLIDPVICKCQNVYCKACIDEWSKNNKKCPNNCDEPVYQTYIGNNDNENLSSLKLGYLGCETEMLSNNAEELHKEGLQEKEILKIKKIEKEDEIDLKKNQNECIRNIRGKKILLILILFYIVITLGDSGVGKTSLIET